MTLKTPPKQNGHHVKGPKAMMIPEAIRQLSATRSQREVGNLIGVSGSTISIALSENKVSATIELAARFILSKETRANKTPAQSLYLVQLPTNHVNTFEAIVSSLGGVTNPVTLKLP